MRKREQSIVSFVAAVLLMFCLLMALVGTFHLTVSNVRSFGKILSEVILRYNE